MINRHNSVVNARIFFYFHCREKLLVSELFLVGKHNSTLSFRPGVRFNSKTNLDEKLPTTIKLLKHTIENIYLFFLSFCTPFALFVALSRPPQLMEEIGSKNESQHLYLANKAHANLSVITLTGNKRDREREWPEV